MSPAIGGDISEVPPWEHSSILGIKEGARRRAPVLFLCVHCDPQALHLTTTS